MAGLSCSAAPSSQFFGYIVYQRLETDFLPSFDEGGFVIDFNASCGHQPY